MKQQSIKQSYQPIYYVLVISLFLTVLSCGKVTQITKNEEDVPTFDLTYSLKVYPTSNATIKATASTPHQQDLTVLDDTIYVQVVGIQESGQKDELSWGRAQLTGDKKIEALKSTANKKENTTYKSTAFDKGGKVLTASDYTWSKLSFNNKTELWGGDSKKVKRKYPVYMVSIFTKQGKYFFKSFEEDAVGKNKVYALGDISDYDTFITQLFLMDLKESKTGLKDSLALHELTSLFTPKFFEIISHQKKKNNIKKFKPDQPVFSFTGSLEKTCLDIANLVVAKELEEAKGLLKKQSRNRLSPRAKEVLLEAIDSFFKEEDKDKDKDDLVKEEEKPSQGR